MCDSAKSTRSENHNGAVRGKVLEPSPREREVLAGIADGMTTGEIAERMNISVHTVDKHRRSLAAKLNARNVAHLVRIAVEQGLHVMPEKAQRSMRR